MLSWKYQKTRDFPMFQGVQKETSRTNGSNCLLLRHYLLWIFLIFKGLLFYSLTFLSKEQFHHRQSIEAVVRRCSGKKVFFKFSQNSQESTCARVSLLKKRLWHRCFPTNFVKFLRTSISIKHLRWLLLKPNWLKLTVNLKLRSKHV